MSPWCQRADRFLMRIGRGNLPSFINSYSTLLDKLVISRPHQFGANVLFINHKKLLYLLSAV